MAINFTDFSDPNKWAQNKYEGISDLLPNILEGYKTARAPMQMDLQDEKMRLANRLSQMEGDYYGPSKQAEIALSEAQRRNQLAQAMMSEFQVKNPALNPHLTQTQRELAAIHGYNTPAYIKALAEKYGIIEGADVPPGSVPFAAMSAGERNIVTKDMNEELKKSEQVTKAYKTLTKMQQIIDKHPNMSDYFSTALVNPNKDPGLWQQLKRRGVNKVDLAAIEEFNKLSSDLVLHGASAFGGQKFTDARQQLIEASKPNSRNTDEANRFVIKHMMEDFAPYEGYSKALQNGLKHRYQVLPVPENYRSSMPEQKEQQYEQQMQEVIQNAQVVPMFKDGKKYNIPVDKVQDALKAGFTNG